MAIRGFDQGIDILTNPTIQELVHAPPLTLSQGCFLFWRGRPFGAPRVCWVTKCVIAGNLTLDGARHGKDHGMNFPRLVGTKEFAIPHVGDYRGKPVDLIENLKMCKASSVSRPKSRALIDSPERNTRKATVSVLFDLAEQEKAAVAT